MVIRVALDSHPGFRVTWETVTPESAEHGDAEARGYMAAGVFSAYRGDGPPFPPGAGPERFRLREAIEALSDDLPGLASLAAIETDGGPDESARWVSAYWNNGAGGSESRSIHIPETASPASRARIVRAVRAAL